MANLSANQAQNFGLAPGRSAHLTTITTPGGARFTVAREVAPQFKAFLTELEGTGYQINRDKSGGYNDRNIAGSTRKSQHAYGNAIDLNWDRNPMGQSKHDLPEGVLDLANKHGIVWGGTFSNPDPMHFEVSRLIGGSTQQPPQGDHSHGHTHSPTPGEAPAPRADQPAEPAKDGDMLNLLAALGGSGNIMGALGKMVGSEAMTNAGASNNVFGSLSSLFGGGQGQDQQGQGQGKNAIGDANMALAQDAMKSAGGDSGDGMQVYQRKPIDLTQLSKLLQQRQLGTSARMGQSGLGG